MHVQNLLTKYFNTHKGRGEKVLLTNLISFLCGIYIT